MISTEVSSKRSAKKRRRVGEHCVDCGAKSKGMYRCPKCRAKFLKVYQARGNEVNLNVDENWA